MQITEIQVVPIKPCDGLVGFASFVLDNSFYLGSIGIYTRPKGGFRLTYPTRKLSGNSFNIFYPINKETAMQIEKEVVRKFEEVMKKYDRYDCSDA